MSSSTTIRSWPSLVIGGFFAAITAWVLLADVIAGAPLTPAHAMSAGAVLAAIASGHYAWPALRRGAVVPAALLCVLFIASTAYVVVASAARNAETGATKSARIAETNVARERELKQLTMAEAMHKGAVAKLDADCVRGKASKGTCDGIRATIAVYDAAIRGHKATLANLGPALAVNGGYAHAAKALAALPGITATPGQIEERLVLVLPFLTVLIAEVGCIVFLHLGIGHGQPATDRQPANARDQRATGGNRQPGPGNPQPPKPGNRRPVAVSTVATRAAAEADVIRLVARGEPLPSQDTLARRWGVHKSTASKWLSDFERRGLIRREWDGRHNRIAAA